MKGRLFLFVMITSAAHVLCAADRIVVEPKDARLTFRAGLYALPDIQTKLRVDYRDLAGTDINFNETLGGESSLNLLRADLQWQVNDSHRLSASWFDISLDGRRTLAIPIIVGQDRYEIGADVSSQLRTNVFKLDYAYTFYSGPRGTLRGIVGAHVIDFDFKIGVSNRSTLNLNESYDTLAPLPVFGLEYTYRFSEKWSILTSAQAFALTLDKQRIEGALYDVVLAGEYSPSRRVAYGLGINRFVIDAKFGSGDFEYDLRHEYMGILGYVSFKW
ncbi:hypothetical protein [Nibricoccus sp. IMCC34717]|uniref:hypothetical protein n=1 Tax=Nibricoccus sp. IMCC34717 TaxID=3034021 RepID=UPI00384DB502